jgi:acetolactate synthase regulatory subunit
METSFKMRVEAGSATAALESALAIIRRGGVQLRGVVMAPGLHGMNVELMVEAEGEEAEDALVLCRMRLCNVIGILKIRVMPRISRPR